MHDVILDPGHGGTQPAGSSTPFGVRGPGGTLEKDVNLALARAVSAELGGRAALTRQEDRNLSLAERIAASRRYGARAFVSLHANGGHAGQRGPEVWVHERAGSQSFELAESVAARSWSGQRIPVHRGPLAVLEPSYHGDDVAATLLEVDYLTDPEVESRLASPGGLQPIAHAIAGGIRDYLGRRPSAYGNDDQAEALQTADQILRYIWPGMEPGGISADHMDFSLYLLREYVQCRERMDLIPQALRAVRRITPPLLRPFIDFYRRVLEESGLLTEACRTRIAANFRTEYDLLRQAGMRPSVLAVGQVLGNQSFDVNHEVQLVPQLTGMSCWAAAASMVVGWRDRVSIDPSEVARGAGHWAAYRAGLMPADIPSLASAWRLQMAAPMTYTIQGFREMLQNHGPLWVGAARPSPHVVCVHGMYGDGSMENTYVRIADPWPVDRGARYDERYTNLVRTISDIAARPDVEFLILHA